MDVKNLAVEWVDIIHLDVEEEIIGEIMHDLGCIAEDLEIWNQ